MAKQSYVIPLLAFVSLIAPTCIDAQAPEKPQWVTVEHGNRSGDLEFDKQNRVWMRLPSGRTYLWTVKADYEIDQISVSPLSPTRRYQVVLEGGAEYGRLPAYIIDFKERKAHKLPLPAYVQEWLLWSPRESYLLMTRDYEGAKQLAVVDVPAGRVRELRPKGLEPWDGSCCGIMHWTGGPDDEGRLEETSVRWLDQNRFELTVTTHSSMYYIYCTTEDDWVRKVFKVEANAQTGKVKQQILKGAP